MEIAIVKDDQVLEVGHYKKLFPLTSFPSTGPDDSFMEANNALGVTIWKPHDKATQKLVSCEPYIEDNQVFTVTVEDKTPEELENEKIVSRVKSVTMRQARLALLQLELLDDVEAAIQQAEKAIQIEWEYATVVERVHPLIEQIATQLELDEDTLDELFTLASTL